MNTELVIFDLDGTLLNTIKDLGNACNHALVQCGFPERELREYNGLVGRGIYNLFRGALPEGCADEKNVSEMKRHFIEYYDAHKCDCTEPYPGITELLENLRTAEIKLAVASNKYQDGTEKLIKHFFGQFDFAAVIGQRDGMPIKPDPEIVYEAMAAAGLENREKVLYVGDSNVDMETGINAGVRTAGVLWGFRTREELAAYRPYRLVSAPHEITDCL